MKARPSAPTATGDSFSTASNLLGTIVGETFGYALTAAWTTLVVIAIGRDLAGRWFQILGATSAALIFVGVLSPLELPVIDTANFVGYILWSVWLISLVSRSSTTCAKASPRRSPRPRGGISALGAELCERDPAQRPVELLREEVALLEMAPGCRRGRPGVTRPQALDDLPLVLQHELARLERVVRLQVGLDHQLAQ